MQKMYECDISVIVPVYNLEKFLLPLIESLKAQDLGDYKAEYIFVLNLCTDKSEEIIKDNFAQAKIYTCDIKGCGCARNVGLDEANGEYVWFMDGDDWLLKTTAIKEVLDTARMLDLNILRMHW